MSRFTDLDIERIALGVRDCTLPKSDWTHAAHFAAAFWLLRQTDMDAMREMPGLIRAYNDATGVANTDDSGYHETITLASLRVAQHWLATAPHAPLHQSLNDFLASAYGRSDWLFAFWSKSLLFSVKARRSWVEPDLRSLTF
jgi:hypothetical protein